jgi:hypothetical protein
MQSIASSLGRYMEVQRLENLQAHLINNLQIRQVEKKVDNVAEALSCLETIVLVLVAVFLLILLSR